MFSINDLNEQVKIIDQLGIKQSYPEMLDTKGTCYYPSNEWTFYYELNGAEKLWTIGLWYTDQDGGQGPFYNMISENMEWY